MKKLFIVTLAVLFFAGAAYAVDYDYSGMLNTRGSYINNSGSTSDDAYDYMYYDMEFDSTLIIKPSDKTFIRLNWEIHDENFDVSPTDSEGKTGDDNIAFKRAWGQYKFDNGWTTQFGLMTGGTFGTAFGDNANGYYRWRVDGTTGIGKVGLILEKDKENGTAGSSEWDAEKDDSDAYAVYLVTKAGDVTLQFLGKYATVGDATGANVAPGGFEEEGADIDIMAFVAAAMGSFGSIGFEAEIDVVDYSFDGNDIGPIEVSDDKTLYGLYGNVWMTMDALKVGVIGAYGSWDDDTDSGFGFGEDFGPGYWVMDWDNFGGGTKAEYYGSTLLSLYGDFAVNDAMSFYAALEYMMSNADDGEWEDATGYVLSASMSYKLADNVTYTVAGAYGKYKDGAWDDGNGGTYDDPDAFARAFHKIQVNF
jgi:hypothetical protein